MRPFGMRRRDFLRRILLGGLACLGASGAASEPELEKLAAEFRELREKKRKLPQGVFDAALSGSGGRLSVVMGQLGDRLGQPPTTRARLIELLGAPDWTKSGREMGMFLPPKHRPEGPKMEALAKDPRAVFLCYHWRGGHDFLFFAVLNGVVQSHAWWAALD